MAQIHIVEFQEQGHSETYTAHIERNGEGWIGWIQELPEVNCKKRQKRNC